MSEEPAQQPTARMRLAVTIVNYRTPQFVIDCLESFAGSLESERDCVVVIDNASGDDSVEAIEASIARAPWRERVSLIRAARNGGFSAGHNIGIASVDAEFYMLLNSDTLLDPGTVAGLLEAAREHPSAGMIGPRIEDREGHELASRFGKRTPMSEFVRAANVGVLARLFSRFAVVDAKGRGPAQPEWLSFACVLMRRDLIDEIGRLDEGYFLFFEDVDYCRRARDAGWRFEHCPTARIVHFEGGSSPAHDARRRRRRPPRYYYESRSRYFAKFHGRSGLIAANLLWHAGRIIGFVAEQLMRRPPHSCDAEWRDIWSRVHDPLGGRP